MPSRSVRLRHRARICGWCGVLDGADLFCAGPLRQSWQDRKSRGRRAWPCSEARLRLPLPHAKQVRPIEQCVGGFLGAVVGLAGLARWVGLAGLAPWWCGGLDGANLFCAGPLRQPWQDRKAGAEKHGPVRAQRYDCRHPTQTESAPSSMGWAASGERWLGWRGWLGGWGGEVGSWWCGVLDEANLFCAGPLRQPWQDRKAGAEKHGPVRAQRYDCRHPTQNKSAPSSSWHRKVRVSSGRHCCRSRVVGLAGLAPRISRRIYSCGRLRRLLTLAAI
ncbi:hypothetical protein JOD54_003503 [Actinokineospora baliensis]|nr:hypothetical protein [Actinokineospora baliensis]